MPRHTQHCTVCEWEGVINVAPFHNPPCPLCNAATERLWTGTSAGVNQDSWEGGKTFENLGHEPVTLYSRSELKRELRTRGLEEMVRHVPGSPHTKSWDVPSAYTLEQAKILLERVGTVSVPVKEERGVAPYATPSLVKEVADAWRS